MGFSEKESIKLYNLAEVENMPMDDAIAWLITVMPYVFISVRDVESLLNILSQNKDIKPTIPELKKRIKYCRNHMERRTLQQKLNIAYKEQKKVKSGKIQKETSSD